MKRWLTVLLVLWLPLQVAHAASLQPFRATYAMRYNGANVGTSELHLERLADGRWSYSLATSPRGIYRVLPQANRKSRSVFRIVDNRVVPEAFTSSEGSQDIAFDWNAGRVSGTAGGKRIDLPAQDGLLDEQSVQVAMMQELLSGRMPARFVLVDEGKIKDYRYAVEGSEVIDSPLGQQRTDIFTSRRPNSQKATYFWCAPDLGFIPLKVERRNGRDVQWSMTLTRLDR